MRSVELVRIKSFVFLFLGKPELKGYRIAALSADEAKVMNSF